MASSMTGLGLGEAQAGPWNITVELRSVNNRFMEASCRLPSALGAHEQMLRERLRNELERGKVYVQVSIQADQEAGLGISVKPERVREVKGLLESVAHEAGLAPTVTLDHVLKFSEIFESTDPNKTDALLVEAFQAALGRAISDIKAMRAKEGQALVDDIDQRVGQLEAHRLEVEVLAKTHAQETHQKLKDRVTALCGESPVDPDRLSTELALMADRMDVTEECVRLASHHRLFLDTLHGNESVGKKLNFLLQEMNREVNTIGSKASHITIQHTAVAMKNEIEKIREQVQNLV